MIGVMSLRESVIPGTQALKPICNKQRSFVRVEALRKRILANLIANAQTSPHLGVQQRPVRFVAVRLSGLAVLKCGRGGGL